MTKFLIRRILLAVCLALSVIASTAQEKGPNSYPCKNQFEVEYIGYEKARGPIDTVNVERETLISEGHTLFTNRGKPFLFATYRYDRTGRLVEKNFYRTDGVALPKTTFDYDRDGKFLRENHFSAVSKKPYLETNYVYQDGLLKESVGRNIEDGKSLSKKVFTYDAARRYFEFLETYSYNSPALRVGFKQDEKCRFAEVFGFGRDGKVAGRNVIEFNDSDDAVAVTSYSGDGAVIGKRRYEYKFDEHGNWVEQSDLSWREKDGKFEWVVVEIAYRKIKYFDRN